jgi:hypothetical protein
MDTFETYHSYVTVFDSENGYLFLHCTVLFRKWLLFFIAQPDSENG